MRAANLRHSGRTRVRMRENNHEVCAIMRPRKASKWPWTKVTVSAYFLCTLRHLRYIERSIRSIHEGANAMTYASRLMRVFLLVFGALILAATSNAQTRPPILEQVAKAYGLDSYGQIEAIRYTWSAQFPGVNVSRTWTWEPKTGKVTYEGKDKDGKPVKVTYLRSDLANQPENVQKEIDPGF